MWRKNAGFSGFCGFAQDFSIRKPLPRLRRPALLRGGACEKSPLERRSFPPLSLAAERKRCPRRGGRDERQEITSGEKVKRAKPKISGFALSSHCFIGKLLFAEAQQGRNINSRRFPDDFTTHRAVTVRYKIPHSLDWPPLHTITGRFPVLFRKSSTQLANL